MKYHATILAILLGCSTVVRADVLLLEQGKARAEIVADVRGLTPTGAQVVKDAADWLAESLERASGVAFTIVDEPRDKPSLVVSRADVWPKIARAAGLVAGKYDDYAIVTRSAERRVYVLGNSEESARFGIADLLRRWGFRWFAPSKKWHVTPRLRDLPVDLTVVESPQLIERRIWYAYGMSGDDLRPRLLDYQRWAAANRLTLRGLTRTGHSYGNIIGRNTKAFANNPQLSAMQEDGSRDQTSVPNARKFCFSNPDLIDLVAQDRRQLLEINRRANPAAFMVSVDPSDGQGTCHCEKCKALGTTTDRVMHLANETAKRLRAQDPRAWVGLYAYSSHRLPPTIDVEPNVYVQVALGFNRTQYSLPELVERWSQKVSAIGLREYYGVQAWDWGLPGRARGGRVAYHRKWIPFYAERNLNGVNEGLNVIMHMSHVGACTGRDHFSGWSLDWVTLAIGYLPYVDRFYAPADARGAFVAVRDACARYGSHIVAIPRDSLLVLSKENGDALFNADSEWEAVTPLRKSHGAKVGILALGATASIAQQAAVELGGTADVFVVNGLPLPEKFLDGIFEQYNGVVTVEDGIIGTRCTGVRGFAGLVLSSASNSGTKTEHIGIVDPRIAPSEGHDEVWEHFGLTTGAIIDAAKSLV